MSKTFRYRNSQEHDNSKLILSTDNIQLVAVQPCHAADIYSHFTEQVTEYMVPEPMKSIEQAHDFVTQCREVVFRHESAVFVIEMKKNKEFIGLCALHGNGKAASPEFGLWIKTSAQGKGYGFAALSLIYTWVKQHLLYDYIIYPVSKKNMASRRLVEKLGGKLVRNRLIQSASGNYLDEVVYHIY